MAHKVINGQAVVDWTTGDPEGDRRHLFRAYRDFLEEIRECHTNADIWKTFKKWRVENLDIDDFPRISISRPE